MPPTTQKKIPLILLALAVVMGLLYFAFHKPAPVWTIREVLSTASGTTEKDCMITKKTETVQGNSMSGLLKDGQEITVLKGYYRCHEVKRDDIIIYPYAGNPIPIVKSVKAIPGDRFEVQANKDGLWNILVNDQILATSNGTPYALSEPKSKMLALYADSYHNTVPIDAYIILGTLPGGTMDSTQFGLVNKSDFIGKVE